MSIDFPVNAPGFPLQPINTIEDADKAIRGLVSDLEELRTTLYKTFNGITIPTIPTIPTTFNDGQTLTLSSDALSPTSVGFCVVSAESGSSDTMDTITPSGWTPEGGDVVFARAANGHTITVDDNSGTNGIRYRKAAFDLDEDVPTAFIWDGTYWRVPMSDEIELGTWTPVLRDSTGALAVHERNGYYWRIGRMCWWSLLFAASGAGSAGTGQLYFEGMPFTIDTTDVGFGHSFPDNNTGQGTFQTPISVWPATSTKMYCYYVNGSDAGAGWTRSLFSGYNMNIRAGGAFTVS